MQFNPYDDFVFFDSCAFDGGDEEEEKASEKARDLLYKNKKKVMLMHSVVSEIRNPNTPDWIREIEPKSWKTVKLGLTPEERDVLREIEDIITGDGKLEKRKTDCFHVFEAQKYGGCFVTSDRGIYKHAEIIRQKYGLYILKPSELLVLLYKYGEKT